MIKEYKPNSWQGLPDGKNRYYNAFIKIDWEAPNSESNPFSKEHIESQKKKYKDIVVIFDYDKIGKEWMERYRNLYGLKTCIIPFAKDIADICKDYPESKQCIYECIKHAMKT